MFKVFTEFCVQESQKRRMGVGGVEGGNVFLCESCHVCVNEIVKFVG